MNNNKVNFGGGSAAGTRQARAATATLAASCVTFRGHEPATTGRVAVAAPVFTQLRGYDEDCHGSGYQDVDFSRRCAAAAKGHHVAAPHKLHGVQHVTLTDSHTIIGYPIANVDRPLDELRGVVRREERNDAKVLHCKNPQGLTWGQFNAQNVTRLRERLSRGQLVRNEAGGDLGWPFLLLPPPELPPPPAVGPVTKKSPGGGHNLCPGPVALVAEPQPPPPHRRRHR